MEAASASANAELTVAPEHALAVAMRTNVVVKTDVGRPRQASMTSGLNRKLRTGLARLSVRTSL